MRTSSWILGTSLLLQSFVRCRASVTVHHQKTFSAPSPTSTSGNYTGLQAYNPVVLVAPAPPGPSAVPIQFGLQVSSPVPQTASIPQNGSFFGFSIEMSVVNQVIGKNASTLQVPFLNLMANLQQRVGRINIRVGGNTQETATLVATTPDGKILEKSQQNSTNPTQTPALIFTLELLYMLRNVSSLVNVRWHLGVPFNDTSNFRLDIVQQGQEILGDYLIGLQVGNEPDLYPAHGHRPANYSQQDYFNEFGLMINALKANPAIGDRGLLLGPSIQVLWTPESVWNTGFIEAYSSSLAFLSVERYPSDNCAVAFPSSGAQFNDPQQTFPSFLTHQSALNLVSTYLNSTNFVRSNGKELLMFETNSASCGGFPGISDSFGAALWGIDYAMQMAAVNFSGSLFHVGGQSVSYNPFTPPPTNESTIHEWTIGPIYYSSLVMAEALGPTNTSQVLDLRANNNNNFTPAYGIWENGNLARVLLINFVSDSTGASDLTVALTSTNGMPGQVQVKYLHASSVSQKGNLTWAGQTFGGNFESDGRPVGTEAIQTVTCNSGTCNIAVPAPAAALVFLTSLTETAAAASKTFPTTIVTKSLNTITVDPSVLATSNGHSGSQRVLGSTSHGSIVSAAKRTNTFVGGGLMVAMMLVTGWIMIFGTLGAHW